MERKREGERDCSGQQQLVCNLFRILSLPLYLFLSLYLSLSLSLSLSPVFWVCNWHCNYYYPVSHTVSSLFRRPNILSLSFTIFLFLPSTVLTAVKVRTITSEFNVNFALMRETKECRKSCPRRRRGRLEEENLGVLLIEFFEFYGIRFNYNNTGIRIADGGSFFNKSENAEMRGSMLCIEDPFQPGNDIARASYSMFIVKEAFKLAYTWLKRAVIAPSKPSEQVFPLTDSILGTLVKVDKVIVEYRHWIKNNWIYMAKMLPHPESYTHDDSIATPPTRREKPKKDAWQGGELSDGTTDQSAEASSEDGDRLTDELTSDSSV
eukprot:sb/3466810/